MEFDKSKVYTVANADELKPGDRVFVANTVKGLEIEVKKNTSLGTLRTIGSSDVACRFDVDVNGFRAPFYLAYLVERGKEKTWRPYADCNEMVEDFKKRYDSYIKSRNIVRGDHPLFHPMIWLKENDTGFKFLLSDIRTTGVMVGDVLLGMGGLFENYTYLDGSLCGMES